MNQAFAEPRHRGFVGGQPYELTARRVAHGFDRCAVCARKSSRYCCRARASPVESRLRTTPSVTV